MCETTTEEQQDVVISIIIDQFLNECEPVLEPSVRTLVMCSRAENAPVPECPENAHWNECGKRCEINFCGVPSLGCTGDETTEPLCMCDTGFVMSDGFCITPEQCTEERNQPGEWTSWEEWSACTAKEPTCIGTQNRIRFCFAPTCGDGEASQEIACSCAVVEGNL